MPIAIPAAASPPARGGGDHSQRGAQLRLALRCPQILDTPGQMSIGNMGCLMRDDGLQHFRAVDCQDQPVIQVDRVCNQ